MDIKIGKVYVNKTWKYLAPSLRGHGAVFVRKFNRVFKLGAGIHDTLLDDSTISDSRNIYFMLDRKYQPYAFEDFLDYIRAQDFFRGDYCPDPDITKSRRHMIVLEVPKGFNDAYDNFLKGSYSKMYTKEQSELLFLDSNKMEEYGVLTKSKESLDRLVEEINAEFKVNFRPSHFTDAERELPLRKSEEIFNYVGKEVFFSENKDKTWQTV